MKVGIIGAGTMGQGIAKAFAQVDGYEVMLCDIDQEFADNGLKKIAAGYETGRERQDGSGKGGCHSFPHQSRTQGRSLCGLRFDRGSRV